MKIPKIEVMPELSRELQGGVQHIYRLSNDYSVSVICNSGSYGGDAGLWEVGVLHRDGHLVSTPLITEDDVKGRMTDDEVGVFLLQVARLCKCPEVNELRIKHDRTRKEMIRIGREVVKGRELLDVLTEGVEDDQEKETKETE